MMRSFVDTNVLVYLFDQDSPKKQAKVRKILKGEATAGRVVLSTQVLQEFYVAVTRKLALPLKPEVAHRAVRHLATLPVMPVGTQLILSAIRTSQDHQLSFWDALIIQAALESGADRLWTEDLHHGLVIQGMRIENPFLSTDDANERG